MTIYKCITGDKLNKTTNYVFADTTGAILD